MYQGAVQVSQDDRGLISLLEHPVALADHFGRILFQNAAFELCQTDTLQDPLKRNIQDFLGVWVQPKYDAFLNRAATDPQSPDTRFETVVVLDGIRYNLVLSPLHPDTQPAVILCQLQRSHPSKDARLDYLMDHFDQGVWERDIRAGVFWVSKVWRTIRGISDDTEILGIEDNWLRDVHPDDHAELRSVVDRQVGGLTDSIHVQYRHRHADGHWIWILCRAKVVEADADGKPIRIVGTDTDVTAMHHRESHMQDLTNKFKMAIDVSGIGIWEYDPEADRVHWDDRLLEIYGREDEDNLRAGDFWETCIHPEDRPGTIEAAEESLRQRQDFKRDFRIVRPDGEIRHIRSLSRFAEDQLYKDKLVGVNIDITEELRRNAELEETRLRLEYDSNHDALTGLANRRLLDERSTGLFTRMTPDQRYAIVQIDLDHFKQINDTLGHAAGDAVLTHVARQLSTIVADYGLTSRIGGDEFVVFFEESPPDLVLRNICETIVQAFKQPLVYEGHECVVGVSVGCAIGQGPPEQSNDIFVQADAALYAAKQAGRGCYRFFCSATRVAAAAEQNARQTIIDALEKEELFCYFQPQFSSKERRIVGAEALVRWQCPERGLLTPDAFMSLADQAGLTERIDAYVFEKVISQQSRWFDRGISYPPIAVNVSKARFKADGLLEHVRSLIQPHHAIVFELLETAFLDDMSQDELDRIAALRSMGVRLDLDDFGSGHSSVAAMQSVRPDRIKFDQRLVAPIIHRPEQLKTLQLIAQMARLEGIGIVIEGLDSSAHLAAIEKLDCDVLQGFALQVPVPADAFEQLLGA